MSRLEFNLLAGWLQWLSHNGYSRENPLMLKTACDLLFGYDKQHPLGLSGNWREMLWDFTAFLCERNFFDREPNVGEMRQWLPAFADSDDWPFNDTNTPNFRAKFANKQI